MHFAQTIAWRRGVGSAVRLRILKAPKRSGFEEGASAREMRMTKPQGKISETVGAVELQLERVERTLNRLEKGLNAELQQLRELLTKAIYGAEGLSHDADISSREREARRQRP